MMQVLAAKVSEFFIISLFKNNTGDETRKVSATGNVHDISISL